MLVRVRLAVGHLPRRAVVAEPLRAELPHATEQAVGVVDLYEGRAAIKPRAFTFTRRIPIKPEKMSYSGGVLITLRSSRLASPIESGGAEWQAALVSRTFAK